MKKPSAEDAFLNGRTDMKNSTARPGTKLVPFQQALSFEEFLKAEYHFHEPGVMYRAEDILKAMIRYIDEVAKPGQVRHIYDICVYRNNLIAATDRGLFIHDTKTDSMVPIEFQGEE